MKKAFTSARRFVEAARLSNSVVILPTIPKHPFGTRCIGFGSFNAASGVNSHSLLAGALGSASKLHLYPVDAEPDICGIPAFRWKTKTPPTEIDPAQGGLFPSAVSAD